MTSVLIVVTVAGIGYSLWCRRDTWWSRWEAAATFAIALEGCALVLMSPWASTELSPLLQRAVGLWNVQELLGHACLVGAIIANIYHGLVRLADPDQVRVIMRRQITVPVAVIVVAEVALFVIAQADYHVDLFSAAATNPWLTGYVLLGCALLLYLGGYIGRLLLALRGDPRATTTVDLYLASMAFAVAAGVILLGSLWIDVDAGDLVWFCLCAAVGVFAYGATKSWRAKAAWFTANSDRVAD